MREFPAKLKSTHWYQAFSVFDCHGIFTVTEVRMLDILRPKEDHVTSNIFFGRIIPPYSHLLLLDRNFRSLHHPRKLSSHDQ